MDSPKCEDSNSMIIDTHQHVFWHGKDDAGLIADMDDHEISLAWLLSWEIPPSEDHADYHSVLNSIHVRPDGTHPGITLGDLVQTRNRYPDRYLFLDSPPVRGSPDARILADLADVVVLVAGYGRDTAASIAQAAANFDPNKFAGVVFNQGV